MTIASRVRVPSPFIRLAAAIVSAAARALRTGGQGLTVNVAQRRCGSGFSRDATAQAAVASSRLKPLPRTPFIVPGGWSDCHGR